MKNKYFSLGLYRDGLRQLRIIGIISLVVFVLTAVLLPISIVLSLKQYGEAMYQQTIPEIISLFTANPLLILSFCLVAPLMMLCLFHFLDKRNASDFYHCIPQTRICLFNSLFAAVMTWMTAIIVITSLCSFLILGVFSDYFLIDWSTSWIFLFNTFAGILFVAASIAIAMCITGTVFTNVIVSGLLIFVPRFLVALMISWLGNALPLLNANSFLPLMDKKYNVVTGMVFSIYQGYINDPPLTALPSGVYTLIVGLIYTGIAMLLFHRRKSESAGNASPNSILQTTYRLVIAMLICLIPCHMIFQNIITGARISGAEVFGLFIMYLIAIFFYFVYELITTKKLANLVKAIPGLLILVGLNVAVIAGLSGAHHAMLNVSFTAEDISYVRFMSDIQNEDSRINYFSGRTEQVEITNQTINKIIADQAQYTTDLVRTNPDSYFTQMDKMVQKRVAIRMNGRTYHRNILISKKDMITITKELTQLEEYSLIYTNLPSLDEITGTLRIDDGPVTADDLNKLYETMKKEVRDMPFETWYHMVTDEDYLYTDALARINLSVVIGNQMYRAELPIGSELKETAQMYISMVNEDKKYGRGALLEVLSNIPENAEIDMTIISYPGIQNTSSKIYIGYFDNYSSERGSDAAAMESVEELADLLKTSVNKEILVDDAFLYITLSAVNSNVSEEDTGLWYQGYFPIGLSPYLSELPASFREKMNSSISTAY